MSEPSDNARHEETVVAVDPGIRRRAAPLETPRRRDRRGLWIGAVAAATLAAVVTVFVYLPRWVEQRPAPAVAARVERPKTDEPALSEQELAALEDEAEQLLAELLPQQLALESVSAASWGGDDWQDYDESYRTGDRAYLLKNYAEAVPHYRRALQLGAALLERSTTIVAAALATAQQAFEAGDAALAIEQFDIALKVEPDNETAVRGRARAERLPDVLERVEAGDRLAEQQQYGDAAEAYREALAIDADWPAAKNGLAAVTRTLADARFERLMSQGFAALADEDFEEADERFAAALRMRPDSVEARDGRVQAEQGMKLDDIALAEARALAFERRELWDRAIAQYEAALATDASLEFAIEGLARARARVDLEAKLVNLIDQPALLLTEEILASAGDLLDEARAVEDRGPKLDEQIAGLDELVRLASTPLPVRLQSDEMTEVTVYRVGRLGRFAAMEIMVRPGTYTVIGSRNGYRDVRKTFTVIPGRDLVPVDIVCDEPI